MFIKALFCDGYITEKLTTKNINIVDGKAKLTSGKLVDLEWLYLVSKTKTSLPEKDALNYRFVKMKENKIFADKWFMYFIKPIVYKKIYRVIPGHDFLAVSRDGVFIDTTTGKEKTPCKTGSTLYPTISFGVDGETLSPHRLIALAWVHNDNPVEKTYINHKDGDRSNYAVSNLEWSTPSYNLEHAYQTGLRTDIDKMLVTYPDGKTETIIGLYNTCRKLDGLITPDLLSLKIKAFGEAVMSDGTKVSFADKEFKTRTPTQDILVKNIKTGEIKRYKGVRPAARDLKMSRSTVNNAVLRGPKYVYGDYTFKYVNEHWPKEKDLVHMLKDGIIITLEKDGEEVVCKGYRDAERKLSDYKINQKNISAAIKNKQTTINGWNIISVK